MTTPLISDVQPVEIPQFLVDLFPPGKIKIEPNISPANLKAVFEILECFFLRETFLQYVGSLESKHGTLTYPEMGLTNLYVTPMEDENATYVAISYQHDSLGATLEFESKFQHKPNYIEDYLSVLTGNFTEQQKERAQHFRNDWQFKGPQINKDRLLGKDWPFINRAMCARGFSDIILIWVGDVVQSKLEKSLAANSELVFEAHLKEAMATGFQPDRKFIGKLADAKISFEVVCLASQFAGLTIEDLLKAQPRLINQNFHSPKFDPDGPDDFQTYEEKFRAYMKRRGELEWHFEETQNPWWYDATWSEKIEQLREDKRTRKAAKRVSQEKQYEESRKVKKVDKIFTPEEQHILDAAPKYGEYHQEPGQTGTSYKKMSQLLHDKLICPDRKTLFFAMRMDSDYTMKTHCHREHTAATFDAILRFSRLEGNEPIVLTYVDLEYVIDHIKPEHSVYEWLLKNIRPTRDHVFRYLESKGCKKDYHRVEDTLHNFLINSAPPFPMETLSEIFIKYNVRVLNRRIYDSVGYHITPEHFKFMLKKRHHHFPLWQIANQDRFGAKHDAKSFNAAANIKASAEDMMTLIDFDRSELQDKDCDMTSELMGFLWRTNPDMILTKDHLALAIRRNMRIEFIFFIMRKMAQPLTTQELCQYLAYFNRSKNIRGQEDRGLDYNREQEVKSPRIENLAITYQENQARRAAQSSLSKKKIASERVFFLRLT